MGTFTGLTSSTLLCVLLLGWVLEGEGCNEAVCASIVSKCTLTKACNCQLNTPNNENNHLTNEIIENNYKAGVRSNCTCCKDCFDCLSYLYSECCSCVELCPKPINHYPYHLNYLNNGQGGNGEPIKLMSQVGDLTEPIPDLFNILMEEKNDAQDRWSSFTYPIDIPVESTTEPPAGTLEEGTFQHGEIVVEGEVKEPPVYTEINGKSFQTVNCTVAFMGECSMPLNKCKKTCHSMGASYFRWFHDGCCECIGKSCTNYGIDESRCANCAVFDEPDQEPEPEVKEERAEVKKEASQSVEITN